MLEAASVMQRVAVFHLRVGEEIVDYNWQIRFILRNKSFIANSFLIGDLEPIVCINWSRDVNKKT